MLTTTLTSHDLAVLETLSRSTGASILAQFNIVSISRLEAMGCIAISRAMPSDWSTVWLTRKGWRALAQTA